MHYIRRADIFAGYCYISGMKEYNIRAILHEDDSAGQKSFMVKFPIGNEYGKAAFDRDMRLCIGNRYWYVIGWGCLMGQSGFSEMQPLTLTLDSYSEISYDGKLWKYRDFGKLAIEIENIKLTEIIAVL